jgi:hypothetical protein
LVRGILVILVVHLDQLILYVLTHQSDHSVPVHLVDLFLREHRYVLLDQDYQGCQGNHSVLMDQLDHHHLFFLGILVVLDLRLVQWVQ